MDRIGTRERGQTPRTSHYNLPCCCLPVPLPHFAGTFGLHKAMGTGGGHHRVQGILKRAVLESTNGVFCYCQIQLLLFLPSAHVLQWLSALFLCLQSEGGAGCGRVKDSCVGHIFSTLCLCLKCSLVFTWKLHSLFHGHLETCFPFYFYLHIYFCHPHRKEITVHLKWLVPFHIQWNSPILKKTVWGIGNT